MGWLSALNPVALVKNIGEAFDRNFTSSEEKLAKLNEKLALKEKAQARLLDYKEKELSARARINELQVQANIAAAAPGGRFTFRDLMGWGTAICLIISLAAKLLPAPAETIGLKPLPDDIFLEMKTLMIALLGLLGYLRTREKEKGVARGQEPAINTAKGVVERLRRNL